MGGETDEMLDSLLYRRPQGTRTGITGVEEMASFTRR
jgi:hypothetical protein